MTNIPDDAIVRIIDSRNGKPLAGNRGRPMTFKGFKNNLNSYRRRLQPAGLGSTGSKYSNPDHWVLEVFIKTDEVAVNSIQTSKKEKKSKGQKRKLNTPEDIEHVCYRYHLTDASVSDIAKGEKVSPATINRVLKEHGAAFCEKNKEEIAEWRARRKT